MKKGMIKVSVLYPGGDATFFDMDYYCNKHLPMVMAALGPALKSGAVEKGLVGFTADLPATYVAMGHLYFDSIDAFEKSFGPHAEKIMGDIPKFTNTQPVIQISEVMV
jgi:uncharacterized protein (TIGR02118 family)